MYYIYYIFIIYMGGEAILHGSQRCGTRISAAEVMSSDLICDHSCLIVLIMPLPVLIMIFQSILPTSKPGCPACLFVHLPAHLLASPFFYSKGKGTFASELMPWPLNFPVVFYLQYFCVRSVMSELGYNLSCLF